MAGVGAVSVAPALCIGVLTANGATPSLSTDSIGCTDSGVTLEEVTVEAQSRRPARVSSDGSVTLDATVTGQRMRAFGEADAMRWIGTCRGYRRQATMLPEYRSTVPNTPTHIMVSEALRCFSLSFRRHILGIQCRALSGGQSGEISAYTGYASSPWRTHRILSRRGLSERLRGWSM